MNKIDFIIASLNNMEDQLSDLNSALGIDKDADQDKEQEKQPEPEENGLEHYTTDFYDTFQNGTPKRTAQNLLTQIDNFIYNAKVELSRLETDVKYDVLKAFRADTLARIDRIRLQ